MARRAIEQRIGTLLTSLDTSIGPLDPPSSWADDVCHAQGVNYNSLSTAVAAGEDGGGIGGSVDQSAIATFADAWIGDYVAKLQNFVAYYNAQYPSHQGDDTAVVSLRADLLPPTPQCSAPGANLLVSSGRLDHLVASGTSGSGWTLYPCASGSTKCLALLPGDALAAPQDGPSSGASTTTSSNPGVATGVTWLSDLAGAGSQDGDDGGVAPPNVVAQDVSLQPGTYVLSWWDQARGPDGSIPSGQAPPSSYFVGVYDPGWAPVARFADAPYTLAPSAGAVPSTGWSARRALPFTIATAGTYRVAFAASAPNGPPGNVAIADVQLEATSASSLPSTYVGTGDSLTVTTYGCAPSAADLRAAFQHNCDPNGVCSYDLVAPLLVDTSTLNGGGGPLDGSSPPETSTIATCR